MAFRLVHEREDLGSFNELHWEFRTIEKQGFVVDVC